MFHETSLQVKTHIMYCEGCDYTFFYKQFIFDPRPKNCLGFSKKSPQKIV